MKFKRAIVFGFIALAIVAAAYCVRVVTAWDSVTVQLDSESSLRVSRKPMDWFLAEYHRRVAVINGGRQISTSTYPPDVGGCFPMLIRFYSDDMRRVVRLTDHLNDMLIDLRTGQFIPEKTPPDGKQSSALVREAELPPLKRSIEIGREMQLTQKHSSAVTTRP